MLSDCYPRRYAKDLIKARGQNIRSCKRNIFIFKTSSVLSDADASRVVWISPQKGTDKS